MKPKHLIVLGALVLVLVAVRLLAGRGDAPARDLGEAGLVELVPDAPEADDVRWVRVIAPAPDGEATPDASKGGETGSGEPTTLSAERSGDGWIVTSAHGAPADAKAVEDFVESVLQARGERRGRGEPSFDDFGVDEAHALRVELGAGDQPAATLLVGRQGDDATATFVRLAGDDTVWHVREEWKRQVGIFGEGAPKPDHWVGKDVLDVPVAEIERVEVERPDARWVLARGEAAPVEPAAEVPSTGDPTPTPAPERPWTLVEPELPWAAQPATMDSAVSRLARLRASGVLDPASDACQPGESAPTARLVTASGAEHVLRLGGPAGDDQVALRIEGQSPCWALSEWTAAALLPRASTSVAVPQAFAEPPLLADVTSIRLERPGQPAIRLVRSGDAEWTLEAPEAGPADASRVSRIVSAMTGLRVDDLALADRVPEPARQPALTVTIEGKGRRLQATLLGERSGTATGERYLRFDGPGAAPRGFVGVVAGTAVESLSPTLEDLKAPAST